MGFSNDSDSMLCVDVRQRVSELEGRLLALRTQRDSALAQIEELKELLEGAIGQTHKLTLVIDGLKELLPFSEEHSEGL